MDCPGVLVVDDQADIRALLQTILRHHGFTVWLAPGGAEAVQLYGQQRDRVDLVLLDVAMPEWDGPRTLKALLKENPDLCVCFVSGKDVEYTDGDLLALGAARVIHRPFEAADVAKVIVGVGGYRRRLSPRERSALSETDRRESLSAPGWSRRTSSKVGSAINLRAGCA